MREWTFTDTMLVIASLLLLLNICTFGLPRYHFYKMRKYNEKLKKLKESEYKGYKTEILTDWSGLTDLDMTLSSILAWKEKKFFILIKKLTC